MFTKQDEQMRQVLMALSRDERSRPNQRATTAEAFRIWLANELHKKEDKPVRGGA